MKRRDERGAVMAEFTIALPVLLLLGLVVIAGVRWVEAYLDVRAASMPAARAATLDANVGTAAATGRAAAEARLADRGRSCASLTVNLDTSSFTPRGEVRATVVCQVDLTDLGIPLNGMRTFRHTAVVPIEQYRKVG